MTRQPWYKPGGRMAEQHGKNKEVVRALLVSLAKKGNTSPTWTYLFQTFEGVVPFLKDLADFSPDPETRHREFRGLIAELCEEGFCQQSGWHLMLMPPEAVASGPGEIQPAEAAWSAKLEAAAEEWQAGYDKLRAAMEEGVETR